MLPTGSVPRRPGGCPAGLLAAWRRSSPGSAARRQNTEETGSMTTAKIFPRNPTARAAYQVVGNPDSTRPEDAVGNCYPGLEADLRNLDRRFFPGLVFNFVARRDIDAPY